MPSGLIVLGARSMPIHAIPGAILSLLARGLPRPLLAIIMLRLLLLSEAGRAVASDLDFVCNGNVDCRI
ncbi:hypothetical protein VSDG_01818 [Cytospora chrysosperma]|uniref:Uncharacterized protein n=1 Tax=Cytospora chrysosperma TaxID=252740 RepID=A0A423WGZ4_CYTCH|nr:hypothetical protein VSDG_01818 [Valsa sordida]